MNHGIVVDNVFVGISLRNKTLTDDRVADILRHARDQFRARRVTFVIADDLELINLRIFATGSEERRQREIERATLSLESTIERGSRLELIPRLLVRSVRWSSVLGTDYWRVYAELFSLFLSNLAFRADVRDITERFATRRQQVPSASDLDYLSLYILAELPTLLRGVTVSGHRHLGMIYPAHGTEAIDDLAERISAGGYGPLAHCKKVCAVVRLPA